MDFIAEALEGSLRAGKSRGGRADVSLTLTLPERSVYQLQRMLEEMATANPDWFKVRAVVLLSEDLRKAVVAWQAEVAAGLAPAVYKFGREGHPEGE